MRVGFLNNQIDNRGTGNALFDYAYHNEHILDNESVIFTRRDASVDPLMEARLEDTFGGIHCIEEAFDDGYKAFKLDVLYHIKYGNDSWSTISLPNCRYVVHAVFDVNTPHGDRFAAVSPWLANRYDPLAASRNIGRTAPPSIPYVPHIVDGRLKELSPEKFENIRSRLGIPHEATVFGRHGGPDTFDIPWVWASIADAIKRNDKVYFIFLGTDVPEWVLESYGDKVFSLPATSSYQELFNFIHSCDAMLHARSRGETFGMACAEFDTRPIITYGLSPERAHFDLASNPMLYFSPAGLTDILVNFEVINVIQQFHAGDYGGYSKFGPEATMKLFDKVFLK